MSKRIFLDIGHGSNTYETGGGKAVRRKDGSIFEEHNFNSDVAIAIRNKLEKLGFVVDWYQKPHSNEIGLRERTNYINKQHAINPYLIMISLHANASGNRSANGYGIFYWHNSSKGSTFSDIWLRNAHELLDIKQWGRGKWKCTPGQWTNFHMVRETTPIAVLIEHFFFSNLNELAHCNTPEYIDKFAEVTVKTVCEYAGVEYTQKEETTVKTAIIGDSECSVAQLKEFLLSKNRSPKINVDIDTFCDYWIEEGKIEGVRGDIAFCQACHETGYFNYGGLVVPSQNNYGGIGATNNSAVGKGAWFDTPQLGVRASIQHLKSYASTEPLKQACIDPRYNLVKPHGKAPYFEDLGGKWAYPGYNKSKYSSLAEALRNHDTYGHMILKIYDALKKVKVEEPTPKPNPQPEEKPQPKEITVEEAKKIIKEHTGLQDGSIQFMYNYRWGDALLIKLAKGYLK